MVICRDRHCPVQMNAAYLSNHCSAEDPLEKRHYKIFVPTAYCPLPTVFLSTRTRTATIRNRSTFSMVRIRF
jgi:hypothetical protein